jgi:Arc/MetJ-type ribon-helix-helix transcriptional regulator
MAAELPAGRRAIPPIARLRSGRGSFVSRSHLIRSARCQALQRRDDNGREIVR